MSGFISSLLIEPVFRRARRRLSRQTSSGRSPSPIHDHQAALHASAPSSVSFPSPEHDYDALVANPQESVEQRMREGCPEPAGTHLLPSLVPLTVDYRYGDINESIDSGSVFNFGASLDRDTQVEAGDQVDNSDSEDPGSRRPIDLSFRQHPIEEGRRVSHEDPRPVMQRFSWDEKGQSALPEDDGMGVLRRRIHAIRDKNASNAEKARLIHDLMTEGYNSIQSSFNNQASSGARSPSSLRSLDRPWTPASHRSRLSFDQLSLTPASTASIIPSSNPYNLASGDLQPTFVPKDHPDTSGQNEQVLPSKNADKGESEEETLGCRHYKRNVKLQCYTCKRWYTCRFCHDEAEDHTLNRRKTENMLCMLCGHVQPASQWCKGCGEQAALYYCAICKLWDNENEKSIYHCSDCGICRIGQGLGKDFFHCKTCSVCMPVSIETTHRCIERSTQCDCPICGDYMFTSPETVVFMRCGHSIHQKCFSEYSRTSYRCPICSKSITNMESQFRNLDRTIESQPMPAEFKDTKALIYCNDCSVKSAVSYHWLGLKCDLCESYNTVQVQLLPGNNPENSEHEHTQDSALPVSRPRASSHDMEDETLAESGTPSQVTSTSVPGADPYLPPRIPSSTDNDGQSVYSIRRPRGGRAVSPIITNYFGLPPERESAKTSSVVSEPIFDNHDNGDDLHFWGSRSLGSKYKFFGNEIESTDGETEAADDDGDSTEQTEEEDEEDGEEEDDDDVDSIELFGHR